MSRYYKEAPNNWSHNLPFFSLGVWNIDCIKVTPNYYRVTLSLGKEKFESPKIGPIYDRAPERPLWFHGDINILRRPTNMSEEVYYRLENAVCQLIRTHMPDKDLLLAMNTPNKAARRYIETVLKGE